MAKKKQFDLRLVLVIGIAAVLFIMFFQSEGSTAKFSAASGYREIATYRNIAGTRHYIDAWGHASPEWKGWTDCSQQPGGRAMAEAMCKCFYGKGLYGTNACYHEWKIDRIACTSGYCASTMGVASFILTDSRDTGTGEAFTKVRCAK